MWSLGKLEETWVSCYESSEWPCCHNTLLLSFWVFVAHPTLLAEETPDPAVKGYQLVESDQTPAHLWALPPSPLTVLYVCPHFRPYSLCPSRDALPSTFYMAEASASQQDREKCLPSGPVSLLIVSSLVLVTVCIM